MNNELTVDAVNSAEERIKKFELEMNRELKKFVGKKVVEARYLTEEEADKMGFYSRPVVIIFNDGTFIVPQMDEEGNDSGVLVSFDSVGKETLFGRL